ncbi:alpha/beta hydrolase [Companilactobacillus allii]|uniref:alpha/beta hydrolase n=1 Tax=Companilactobacillus allii TaxID=1847728 RepID=UPI0012FF872E|nr:alpha/beta hydrolase [Companilactobacillus allii]USQ67981.1 alpha/beta hydrolase [Companilactobacillus allii]
MKKLKVFIAIIAFLAIFNVSKPTNVQAASSDYIPTIYLHGHGAGARSTDDMINFAQTHFHATRALLVVVDRQGVPHFFGTMDKSTYRPIVQVVFKDNMNTNFNVTSGWLHEIMTQLKQNYGVTKFNAVAHSMGNMTLLYYMLNYGKDKNLPQLNKQVDIAGHYDGIAGIKDKPNSNWFMKSGRPAYITYDYQHALKLRKNYPYKQVKILNFYGNLSNGTNTDGRVSTVSARSIKYILRGRYKSYRQVKITGYMGEHSMLHENPKVDRIMGDFLWNK